MRPSRTTSRSPTTQLDNLVVTTGASQPKLRTACRHGIDFLEPIHNVKGGASCAPVFALARKPGEDRVFISGKFGGACRDRTDDLKLAKLALFQLS